MEPLSYASLMDKYTSASPKPWLHEYKVSPRRFGRKTTEELERDLERYIERVRNLRSIPLTPRRLEASPRNLEKIDAILSGQERSKERSPRISKIAETLPTPSVDKSTTQLDEVPTSDTSPIEENERKTTISILISPAVEEQNLPESGTSQVPEEMPETKDEHEESEVEVINGNPEEAQVEDLQQEEIEKIPREGTSNDLNNEDYAQEVQQHSDQDYQGADQQYYQNPEYEQYQQEYEGQNYVYNEQDNPDYQYAYEQDAQYQGQEYSHQSQEYGQESQEYGHQDEQGVDDAREIAEVQEVVEEEVEEGSGEQIVGKEEGNESVKESSEEKRSLKSDQQSKSLKKKDAIRAILDSDTESTIEVNASNTESDFDFN